MTYGPIMGRGVSLQVGSKAVGYGHRASEDGLYRFLLHTGQDGYPTSPRLVEWSRTQETAPWTRADWQTANQGTHAQDDPVRGHSHTSLPHNALDFSYIKASERVLTAVPDLQDVPSLTPQYPTLPSQNLVTTVGICQIWPVGLVNRPLVVYTGASKPQHAANAPAFVMAEDKGGGHLVEYWAFVDPSARIGTTNGTTNPSFKVDTHSDLASESSLGRFLTWLTSNVTWGASSRFAILAVSLGTYRGPVGGDANF